MNDKFVYRLILEKYLINDLVKVIIGYCEVYPRVQTICKDTDDYDVSLKELKLDSNKTYEYKIYFFPSQEISVFYNGKDYYLSKGESSIIIPPNEYYYEEDDLERVFTIQGDDFKFQRVQVTAIMLD